MNQTRIILVSLVSMAVSACSVSTPACGDDRTKKLVLEITNTALKDKFKNFAGLIQAMAAARGMKFYDNYESIKLTLDDVRTSDKNEKTGKLSCTAKLIASAGSKQVAVDIAYSSELANNGDKHYVQVFDLSDGKQGELLGGLMYK